MLQKAIVCLDAIPKYPLADRLSYLSDFIAEVRHIPDGYEIEKIRKAKEIVALVERDRAAHLKWEGFPRNLEPSDYTGDFEKLLK